MSMKTRITDAAEKVRKNGIHPQHVHLTKSDATQLQHEMIAEGGSLSHAIIRDGIKKSVPTVLGLQIVWGSPAFMVV